MYSWVSLETSRERRGGQGEARDVASLMSEVETQVDDGFKGAPE